METLRVAQDIMVRKLITLRPEAHVLDGIHQLLRHRITGAPVVESDQRYLGVFSEKCSMSVLTLMARLAAQDDHLSVSTPLVRDFMVTNLVTVRPKTDVFEAIGYLLKHSISGAPVVDENRNYIGVFSEKTSMQVLVNAAYEQLPSTEAAAFANRDLRRVISEETDLITCAQLFLDTPFRRLPVLREGLLVGQISRRDLLKAIHRSLEIHPRREKFLLYLSSLRERSEAPIE